MSYYKVKKSSYELILLQKEMVHDYSKQIQLDHR